MRLYLLHCNCVCADFNVSRQFLAKNLKGNRNKQPLSRKISGNQMETFIEIKNKKQKKLGKRKAQHFPNTKPVTAVTVTFQHYD